MAEYLSPEDFEIAERNGISEVRVKQRFYKLGWSKRRSITQELKPIKYIWKQYKDICVVSMGTFYDRVSSGWTHEEAALTPKQPNGKRFKTDFPISQEIRDLAEKNGIKFGTLRNRIYEYKWQPEDAATLPAGSRRPGRGKRK